MSEKSNPKDKKLPGLLIDLNTVDPKKQLAAIKALKVHGNATIIAPLLDVCLSTDSEEIKAEIVDILNTAKSESVPKEIARFLNDTKYEPLRQILLASIWSSGLDYSDYLKEIVEAAVKGEMMDALECITIVENIEEELNEDQLFEPILVLTEYLVANSQNSSPKTDLLKEILLFFQTQNDAN